MFGWADFQSSLEIAEMLFSPKKTKRWEKQRGSRIAFPFEMIPSEYVVQNLLNMTRLEEKKPKRKHTCHKTKNTHPLEGGNTSVHEATTKPNLLHSPPMSANEFIPGRPNAGFPIWAPCQPHLITGCFGPDTTSNHTSSQYSG